jgi:hypothetical protein
MGRIAPLGIERDATSSNDVGRRPLLGPY